MCIGERGGFLDCLLGGEIFAAVFRAEGKSRQDRLTWLMLRQMMEMVGPSTKKAPIIVDSVSTPSQIEKAVPLPQLKDPRDVDDIASAFRPTLGLVTPWPF